MQLFLTTLQSRNRLLFYFGWFCGSCAIVCFALSFFTHTNVLGINAWIKPTKFFISTVFFSWSMGWFLFYLNEQRKTILYSWALVLCLLFELVYIVWQAGKGELSHFNISSAFHGMMFSLMGVVITIITAWTGYIAFLFWKRSFPQLPEAYVWGIRFGLLLFVVFAFAGGIMASRLSHTVGIAMETTKGLPFVNWSTQAGDLRIAHFFGMHALQLLPLLGFYIARSKQQIILFSMIYALLVSVLLWQALKAVPLISI
jgi:hypothetical protein